MHAITENEFKIALAEVGISNGQIIMVHSDLTRIGWVSNAKSRSDILDFYFKSLLRQVGPEGTLVVLTCTESFARDNVPFNYEQSPSEQGVLSEFIRNKKGSIRSMHPLFSVAAYGAKSQRICGTGICNTAFGYGSPFQKLYEMDAQILCIGVDLLSITFVHHVEQMYGVPYGYTKEWDNKVYRGGKISNERFFAFVRYLDSDINYNFSKMQNLLLENGLAKKSPLGLGSIWSVSARDIFNIGIEQLRKDPFFFLDRVPRKQPWKK